ncbi:uncharacterized protein [Desmodus rotundus]|uniref:uncharacterized protein isoform X2 n=1 Tax=Desmodus rotundus TaxID=9430 RepID=UPI0039E37453
MSPTEGPVAVAEMLMDPAQCTVNSTPPRATLGSTRFDQEAGTRENLSQSISKGFLGKDEKSKGRVVLEDVAIHFSQEEWGLLDEAQRHLYHSVMLENLALLSSIGCWPGAQEEEVPLGQGDSVRVSQVQTPNQDPCTQKSHSWEMCGPVLKDMLHLDKQDGTHPQQEWLPLLVIVNNAVIMIAQLLLRTLLSRCFPGVRPEVDLLDHMWFDPDLKRWQADCQFPFQSS